MKQEPVFVIPKEGVKIRNDHGQGHIPAEGDFRVLNTYYNRRIMDGDLSVRDGGGPAPIIESKDANDLNDAGKGAGETKEGTGKKGNK